MNWATSAAIIVVLIVWAVTVLVGIFDSEYTPPPGIEPLMMALAGFLFAAQHKTKGEGKGAGKHAKPEDKVEDEDEPI